jgi:hypothetical protein
MELFNALPASAAIRQRGFFRARGKDWLGGARQGLAWRGTARTGLAGHGGDWHGKVRPG